MKMRTIKNSAVEGTISRAAAREAVRNVRRQQESGGVLALLDGNTPEGRLTFVVDDADLPMKAGFYRLVPEAANES